MTPIKQTKGTIMARKVRERCNSMTPEERKEAIRRAEEIIYANSRTVSATARRVMRRWEGMFRKLAE